MNAQTPSLRERLLASKSWKTNMVVAGLANAVAEIPQAWTVIKTGDTNSISLTMFWLFLFIQSSFGLQAYVNKDRVMMYSLMVSGMFTAIILVSATYLRCR